MRALKACLPPQERRGLVLMDPPYESLDELKDPAARLRGCLSALAERHLSDVVSDPQRFPAPPGARTIR